MDEALISVRNLCKAFNGVKVLDNLSADVFRGEVVSVIGPSGTGKSTFLRCLNRLERPDSGSIAIGGVVQGTDGKALSAIRRRMGMVFQNFNLFGHLSAVENIMAAPCAVLRRSRAEARAKALELLARVGLADRADARPGTLSGGQKQRVAIARALAMDPEILLFDEPTSALDPTMVGEVLSVINELAATGMTMLIVTHEMGFAREVSSRILYLDEGCVYEEGTPAVIFGAPKRPKTAAFVGKVCVKQARDMLRLLRDSVLEDGRVDAVEVEMLRRMLQPLARYGATEAAALGKVLDAILADGVVTEDESRALVEILRRM